MSIQLLYYIKLYHMPLGIGTSGCDKEATLEHQVGTCDQSVSSQLHWNIQVVISVQPATVLHKVVPCAAWNCIKKLHWNIHPATVLHKVVPCAAWNCINKLHWNIRL